MAVQQEPENNENTLMACADDKYFEINGSVFKNKNTK